MNRFLRLAIAQPAFPPPHLRRYPRRDQICYKCRQSHRGQYDCG